MFQRLKPIVRACAFTLAVIAGAVALLVFLVGGIRTSILVANDPLRPLIVSAAAALLWVGLSGITDARKAVRRNRSRCLLALAIIISVSPALAGLARNSWTAGGADSYAYVSQTDRWLHFRLKTRVGIAASAPWPRAIWSFAPYGYRPAPDELSLVPVTAPGLPLLMAAAKAIAGHCAMFWVTPLCGALLVWTTFALGRRVSSAEIGLAAAWLVATSPAVLAMLVSPMSDVPAAAFWAVSLYFALSEARDPSEHLVQRRLLYSAAAATVAILIRPNLVPLAAIVALATGSVTRGGIFLALLAPACLFIAGVNGYLYGSPVSSGYGDVGALFSSVNVAINLSRYGSWLIDSQTLLSVAGLAALALPSSRLWPTNKSRRAALAMAAFVIVVWALYLVYTPFDAWWYLRFLLPSWPAMCFGGATLVMRLLGGRSLVLRASAVVLLILVGVHGLVYATDHGAFPSGEGDHRYASIAKLTEQFTEPTAVVIAGQNAGPINYYGGRQTVRFDLLDEAWLDRAIDWLAAQHRHPYILVEEWEMPLFQQRFASKNRLGALGFPAVMAYRAPGVPGSAYLFDPLRTEGTTLRPPVPDSARRKCVEPAQEPALH